MSDRAAILGCQVDRLDFDTTLGVIEHAIDQHEYTQHMAVNAAKLVAMHDDDELAAIIDNCQLVNADGQSVVWASRILGDPLPERVAGIDLMVALLGLAERRGYRPFFLGARDDVLQTALARIREQYPALQIAGSHHGYFDEEEEPAICEQIRADAADIVFVAMTSPRKELFLGRYGADLGASFVMGVGGSIDVIAGVTRRAPLVWQRLGLEWLFRLLQEPRRMFRRYAVTNARFIGLVARAAFTRRASEPNDAQGDLT